MRAARGRQVIGTALGLLLVALIIAAGIGSVPIPPSDLLRILADGLPGVTLEPTWQPTHALILWQIRLPRVVLAALVGASLGVAGGAYQGLFRNPLADPYILGVSSGAAVGAALAIALLDQIGRAASLPHWLKLGPVPVLAFAGGLITVTLVYRLATAGGKVPVIGLLLAGVAVGSLATAIVSLIMYLTRPQARDAILFWMMGGLGGANWLKVAWILPHMAAGGLLLLLSGRELNAMLMGEETAHHLGVGVERLKRQVLTAGALLTASAVAFSGAIGFVGLIVPHLVRLLIGPDHRFLLPAAAVVGALVLVLADTLARSLLGAIELPVGLVMAVLGGPFFLWLLRRRLRALEG